MSKKVHCILDTSVDSVPLRILFSGLVVVLALGSSFGWAAAARAQSPDDRSADVQYEKPAAASGPVAGATSEAAPGGKLLIEGDLCVASGASVTVEDSNRTRGTFIDEQGASITKVEGGVLVSGSPQNVTGGDRRLDTGSASVVSSTGISQQCSQQASGISVLPSTAGASLILLALGVVLVATGAATAFLRRFRFGGRR